jgi:hypothetical protein
MNQGLSTFGTDIPHDSRYRVKTSHDLEKKISTTCYVPSLLNNPGNLRDLGLRLTDPWTGPRNSD